jgi:hypothetical protein
MTESVARRKRPTVSEILQNERDEMSKMRSRERGSASFQVKKVQAVVPPPAFDAKRKLEALEQKLRHAEEARREELAHRAESAKAHRRTPTPSKRGIDGDAEGNPSRSPPLPADAIGGSGNPTGTNRGVLPVVVKQYLDRYEGIGLYQYKVTAPVSDDIV